MCPPKHPKRSSLRPDRPKLSLRALLLCSSAFGVGALAQDGSSTALPDYSGMAMRSDSANAITNQPPVSPLPDFTAIAPISQIRGTSQLASSPANVAPLESQPLFHLGPVNFHPHLEYRFFHAAGLQVQPGEHVDSYIHELMPGMQLMLGRHWSLNYTPLLRFYSNKTFQNSTEHAVLFRGATTYQEWRLGLSQAFALTSGPLVETGSQTDQQNYNTTLSAAYDLSSRVSLEMDVNQDFRFIDKKTAEEQLTDLREWSVAGWVDYEWWPGLRPGIGVNVGYDDVSFSSDNAFERLLGRVSWQVSQKVEIRASGGFEVRQFIDSATDDAFNPVFDVSLLYQPLEQTTLSVNGRGAVSPSYFQDQLSTSTGVGVGLRQRLLKHFYLDLNAGYSSTSYDTTQTSGSNTFVSDGYDTYSFQARLGTTFLKRGTASVFYQYNEFASPVALYDYSTTQVGVEVGYRF